MSGSPEKASLETWMQGTCRLKPLLDNWAKEQIGVNEETFYYIDSYFIQILLVLMKEKYLAELDEFAVHESQNVGLWARFIDDAFGFAFRPTMPLMTSTNNSTTGAHQPSGVNQVE